MEIMEKQRKFSKSTSPIRTALIMINLCRILYTILDRRYWYTNNSRILIKSLLIVQIQNYYCYQDRGEDHV